MATHYSDNIVRPEPQAVDVVSPFVIRKISLSDLSVALRLGWEDFQAMPSHAIVLCVIYPVLGLVLFRMVLGYSVLPLLFPFGTWIAVADAIYIATFGNAPAASIPDFATRVLTTPEGWSLIIVGCGIGFLFAIVALCVSVVSFPLMLDRHATAIDAIRTSLRAVMKNPFAMAAWGVIVALLLVIGSLPFFVGLAVVLPVLGHATWHLYRKVVEPDPNPPQEQPRPPKEGHRYAADFPASLFPWSRERK